MPMHMPMVRGPRGEGLDSTKATQVLIGAIRQLAASRTLAAISEVVRHAARALVNADGATFVLRERDHCFYLDEEAISPLWKGQRFPLQSCVSGWAMLNNRQVAIEDIFQDERVPHDAYRPTFVKSLVMTPVRRDPAHAAIGIYWAKRRRASRAERDFLQDLADATAVAMESAELYESLEAKVEQRTCELRALNKELEAFSYSVAHDLRSPLSAMMGFTELLASRSAAGLDAQGAHMLQQILAGGDRMNTLITDLLDFARCNGAKLARQAVDLSALARDIAARLKREHAQRLVEVSIEADVTVHADPGLMRVVLENLFGNAFKYSRDRGHARVCFGTAIHREQRAVFVRDNGAGFEVSPGQELFTPFQRFHSSAQFEGTGVGLATVARIVRRHGGEVWAESAPGEGASFFFSLPDLTVTAS